MTAAAVALAVVAAAEAAEKHPAQAGQTHGASRVETACAIGGSWIDAGTGARLAPAELFRELGRKRIVLLGETHSNAEHHHWQLHTLAALHGHAEKLVIGFEMFPRRAQTVLDDWVAGKLTAKAFLKASDWRKVWGFGAEMYLPLFHFARLNRIPMIALNVDRALIARVGREGWESVPEEAREGLSAPAPASAAYRRALARIYLWKAALKKGKGAQSQSSPPAAPDEKELAKVLQDPGFQRFVQAQLTWDRAMAEALAEAKRKHPEALIVGVLGSGHIEHGHGVPHQLADLGIPGSAVLIPVESKQACDKVGIDYADAMFTVTSPSEERTRPGRPMLGVMVRDGENAARVERVVPNSVAEAAKLETGDRIVRAAGLDVRSSADLIEIIRRQAPGTWLPLIVKRGAQTLEIIAKFPTLQDKKS